MEQGEKQRTVDVDSIQTELGELGRYQVQKYILFAVAVLLTSSAYFSYIFTAGQLDYRYGNLNLRSTAVSVH